jgi:hypothetical protein
MLIKDFPDYHIFRNGSVLSEKVNQLSKRTKGFLKPYEQKDTGYLMVNLYKNKKCVPKRIHRLVAEHFIPNSNPNYKCVDHIDRIKTNNKISNLRWCNHSINNLNKVHKLGVTGIKGITYTNAKNRRKKYIVKGKRFLTLEEAKVAKENLK